MMNAHPLSILLQFKEPPMRRSLLRPLLCTLALFALALPAHAVDPADGKIKLADGALELTAPKEWVRKEPKSRIVEHEFAAPVAEGDTIEGRITIMGAGGDVQQNIDRWAGQFVQPDGKDSKDVTKVTKKKVNGLEIHVVDIGGTYQDMPGGPFAGGKPTPREGFRMLGAIIIAPKIGNYFVKFYGPAKTVAKYEADFGKMLDGLTVAAQ